MKSVALVPLPRPFGALRSLWDPDEGKTDSLARVRHLARELRRGRDLKWGGPGTVRLDGEQLVFEDDDRAARTSLSTIEAVERDGPHLWIKRRRAHDWLIWFENAADAERIEAAVL